MKTLKQILELYEPDTIDGKAFVQKHVIVKTTDANGNGDDVFQATNVKKVERKKEKHGHEPAEDTKVYESAEQVDEMSKSMAYATGTKSAMASTGDKPPLEKSTIKKAHKIAKAILRKEEFQHFMKENVENLSEEDLDLIEQIYNELDEEESKAFISLVENGELDSFLEEIEKALEEKNG